MSPFRMKAIICASVFLLQLSDPIEAYVNVAAYYYPWHSNGFHNGEGYVRKLMNQTPELGEYDDTQPKVILQHMKWSQQANIGVWITSWFGPNSRGDSTMRSTVLPTITGSSLKFAIFYESGNRVGMDNPTTNRVVDDVHYICDNFLSHPNYYHIGGKPVLFVYVTRVLERNEILAEVILLIRTTGSKRGFQLYIVGDHAFGDPPDESMIFFDFFDAITNYDVYGSLGRFYVGKKKLAKFYKSQKRWKNLAAKQDCSFMPSVTPGFNDRGVRLASHHAPLSRKLSATGEFGSLFQASLAHAMTLVDPSADNLVVVTSFNEWHEDTQIEPVIGNLTNLPYNYTMGLEYDGYGTLYLDILGSMSRNGTFTFPKKPFHSVETGKSISPLRNDENSTVAVHSSNESCGDSHSETFPTQAEGEQTCRWLAERPHEVFRYCNAGEPAYDLCKKTCDRCTESCSDTVGLFAFLDEMRSCAWLKNRRFTKKIVCKPGSPAYESVCLETCGACDRQRRYRKSLRGNANK